MTRFDPEHLSYKFGLKLFLIHLNLIWCICVYMCIFILIFPCMFYLLFQLLVNYDLTITNLKDPYELFTFFGNSIFNT